MCDQLNGEDIARRCVFRDNVLTDNRLPITHIIGALLPECIYTLVPPQQEVGCFVSPKPPYSQKLVALTTAAPS